MARILRNLPFLGRPSAVSVGGRLVGIKPEQIVVWVSLFAPGRPLATPGWPRFPAVLDTGLSYTFSLREDHLTDWAGLHPSALRTLGSVRLSGLRAKLLSAHCWLYPNQPGRRDELLKVQPFRFDLAGGIAVYPRDMPQAPRLPLLGLRALQQAGLHLWINCRKREVHLSTSRWWWLFG